MDFVLGDIGPPYKTATYAITKSRNLFTWATSSLLFLSIINSSTDNGAIERSKGKYTKFKESIED